MKALFYNYPWSMDVPGGGERQLLAYAHHLPRFGVEVDLYDMWKSRLKDYQLFHVFSVMPGVIEMCDYAKSKGLKLIVSPNLWVTQETKNNYPYSDIWNILELADRIVVNSNMEGDALSDVFGIDRSKFHRVFNGAEADFLVSVSPSVFRGAYGIDGPFVLNVANIEERKNQLEFLRLLREERPDLTFVIAGSIRNQYYADACKEAGGDRLRIVGNLPYASEMLRSALSGCEFFAMPSLLETPSIAAIEAAALGCRVLLTKVGSTREYFGDSVTYVDPWSRDSMRTGIGEVAGMSPDKSIWAARDRLLWPLVMPEVVRCYESVL
ncbi:glycosyltransferase [Burkholderia stagnalis]|uniref:glycosyltransferase n=1 Tax=Burkholderia stagnalis TaxID=1503054 RepID=UPI0007C65AE1|nr:glycosyltransferase [Burkholderia stagnalis]